jgi:hypothetical protein
MTFILSFLLLIAISTFFYVFRFWCSTLPSYIIFYNYKYDNVLPDFTFSPLASSRPLVPYTISTSAQTYLSHIILLSRNPLIHPIIPIFNYCFYNYFFFRINFFTFHYFVNPRNLVDVYSIFCGFQNDDVFFSIPTSTSLGKFNGFLYSMSQQNSSILSSRIFIYL